MVYEDVMISGLRGAGHDEVEGDDDVDDVEGDEDDVEGYDDDDDDDKDDVVLC